MNKFILGMCYIRDILLNIFSREQVVLISESAKWAIYEDCKNIKEHLQGIVSIRIAFTPIGLRNKIVHFASVGTLIGEYGFRHVSPTNKIVLAWFHLNENDGSRLKQMPEINRRVSYLYTSSTITAQQLLSHGLKKEKLVIIPVGVDTIVFRPVSEEAREQLRGKFDIPPGKIVIGSFQKDGGGWGEGLIPKMVKGPDIFCDTVEHLAKHYPIHVVLTGPARGYVKKRLEAVGISYSHFFTKKSNAIAPYYHLLDVYLITSRVEGGPKALLESAASGIPVVTTLVGMVPDIMDDGNDCLVTPVEDSKALAEKTTLLISDREVKQRLVRNALEKAKKYDIRNTVRQYDEKIYRHLLLK